MTQDDTILSVESLSKTFEGKDEPVQAVDDVSFEVQSGTVVGLLGPNGAGKTTIIKSILGLVVPTEGKIELANVNAVENPKQVNRHVDAMLEGARNIYWRLTVRENVAFFARLAGQNPTEISDRIDDLLERFDIAEMADVPVQELSRGQKQKVSLLTTLCGDAEILFLDEPTLGLDVESSLELRGELARMVAEENLTVFLSSHDMDVIEEICDRVVIVNDGRIIADDTPENLVTLFDTRSYEFVVEGAVSGSFKRTIEEQYQVAAWEQTADQTRFGISLSGTEAIHDLIGRVADADLRILEINTNDHNFEDVFLSLTREKGPSRRAKTEANTNVDSTDDTDLPGNGSADDSPMTTLDSDTDA